MKRKVLIEICVDSIESALAAQKGGADRIELCSALGLGGLTPSKGMIDKVIALVDIPVYVMIRPREGDFLYSDAEFEVMKSDVFMAKMAGAAGIVTGILNRDSTVDSTRMKELIEISGTLPVTFHRAFDMILNKHEALEQIIISGCKRILTSGGNETAIKGSALIASLVQQAADRISIMAGSGINERNFLELSEATGCREYHLSASVPVRNDMLYENLKLVKTLPSAYKISDIEKVKAICDLASSIQI